MRINLQLQTSAFVDVDLACDHCYGSSKSQKTHLRCNPTYGPPWGGSGLQNRPPRVLSTRTPGPVVITVNQGSNWLLAVGAEKRGRGSKRISSGGFRGRFRPQMGSKGSVLGGGPGGRARAILVFKSTFPASETHLDRNSEIHFFNPYPPCINFSTDLHWSQEWSNLVSKGLNSAHGLKSWNPVNGFFGICWSHSSDHRTNLHLQSQRSAIVSWYA